MSHFSPPLKSPKRSYSPTRDHRLVILYSASYVGLPCSVMSVPDLNVSRSGSPAKPYLESMFLPTNTASDCARCCGVREKPLTGTSPAVSISRICSELRGGAELNWMTG